MCAWNPHATTKPAEEPAFPLPWTRFFKIENYGTHSHFRSTEHLIPPSGKERRRRPTRCTHHVYGSPPPAV